MTNPNPNQSTRFSSTNQPKNKNGRKKSKLIAFIKEEELSSDDVSAAIKLVLLMNEAELKELGNDKEKPMLLRSFANAMADDIKRGGLSNINSLLDRAIGKVTDKSEVKIMDMEIGAPPTMEEAKFPEEDEIGNEETT